MYHILYVDVLGEEKGKATVNSSEKALEEIQAALGLLKRLPYGARIIIAYKEEAQDNADE